MAAGQPVRRPHPNRRATTRSCVARYYDPAIGQFLTRDPMEAGTRSVCGYAGNDPINRVDPTGMFDIPGWVPFVGGMCVDIADPDCVTAIEGRPNDVADFGLGVLSMNPITATTNALGLTDTSQYADTCSGWYTAGQVSMAVVDVGVPAHAGWTALNSGRGIGLESTMRVARHQARRAMPELAGGAARRASWLQSHHAFRTHWHWTWRGVRTPGGM